MSLLEQRGHSLLELVLFTPLALLFLFVVVDGGLYFTERAVVNDAMRAALNAEVSHFSKTPYAELAVDGSLSFDESALEAAAKRLTLEVASRLVDRKSRIAAGRKAGFGVEVVPIHGRIDPSSGVLGVDELRFLEASYFGSEANSQSKTGDGLRKRVEFIEQELAGERFRAPSRYAVPTIRWNGVGREDGTSLAYNDRAVFFYLRVEARANATGGGMLELAREGLFRIDEQELFHLRSGLR